MNLLPHLATRRTGAIAVMAGALALSMTACGADTDGGVVTVRSASAQTGTDTQPTATAAAVNTARDTHEQSRMAAAASAENAVAGGQITDMNLANGVWAIDVMTGEPRVHNLSVDAATGALLTNRADRMPDQARSYLTIPLAKLAAATVSRDQAAEVALRAAGGGFVTSLSIQGTESRPLWAVEIADGSTRHKIDVDARTAAVTDHDIDSERTRRTAVSRPTAAPDRGITREEIRDYSRDFGREHYDWSRHLPR